MNGNAVINNMKRKYFVAALFSVAMIILAGCKFSFHDDVYPAAGEKYRVIAPAVISPGTGTSFAFTRANVPTITITCSDEGAVAYYSLDGGTYQQYTEPFTLPVANYQLDQTIVLSAYTTHPYLSQSEPVSQTYQFVATKIPTPSIDVDIPLYYHYNNPPWVVLSCSLADAQIQYSLDGGATYKVYSGAFLLPIPPADLTTNNSYTITVYASSSGYIDSDPESRTFPFLAEGTIITIAGNGTPGYSGDGIPATEASLSTPQGLYVDASGNVYIADYNNNRIRMVDTNGIITTLAGNGSAGDPSLSEGLLATEATVQFPQNIAVDEVHQLLYVVDNYDFRVRTVPLAGGIISSFTGTAGTTFPPSVGVPRLELELNVPCNLFYDSAVQKLYLLDYANLTVWGLLPGAGATLERIAGNGLSGTFSDGVSATSASFPSPSGIARDEDGDLYLIGRMMDSIIRFTPGGAIYHTSCTGLVYPSLLCSDGTSLYFLDGDSTNLMQYTISSNTTTVLCPSCDSSSTVLGDGGLASGANLNYPSALFVVPGDGIYISDTGNHRVRKIILY